VFAGQAVTPFVMNIRRTEARIMDGGHRIHTLLQFKRNEVAMLVKTQKVFYSQLDEVEKAHFDDQDMLMFEYKMLAMTEEIGQYIMINSGLPFSIGEKLSALHQVNSIVKTSHRLIRAEQAREGSSLISNMCAILGKDSGTQKGRKNELLIATFCAYNLFFRCKSMMNQPLEDPQPMFTTLGEQFVQVISEKSTQESSVIPECDAEVIAAEVLTLMNKATHLYDTITQGDINGARRRTGQTEHRRMIICLLAVAEIADLDADVFSEFVASVHESDKETLLRRILTSSSNISVLNGQEVRECYEGFKKARLV
jgi:hypothetical protein